jgi:hypothetical protein
MITNGKLKIGMVAYDGKRFWRIVGWVGKRSAALREVVPVYRSKGGSGFFINWYSFKAVNRELKIKSLDWYYENCTIKPFKEIQQMEKDSENDNNIKKTG